MIDPDWDRYFAPPIRFKDGMVLTDPEVWESSERPHWEDDWEPWGVDDRPGTYDRWVAPPPRPRKPVHRIKEPAPLPAPKYYRHPHPTVYVTYSAGGSPPNNKNKKPSDNLGDSGFGPAFPPAFGPAF
jgi:hypothetical protein